MSTFYEDLESTVKEAWLLDRRRVIREAVELAVCWVVFMIAVVLMYCRD
jgi:hypothetical protein